MKNFYPLQLLLLLVACKNNDPKVVDDGKKIIADQPAMLSYTIISPSFPHDTASFTQGLCFYKGELYEGTGMPGKSKLMKVDLKTGKALQTIKLDDKYFGEGITVLNDTIYQLTWQDNVVFVYTLDFKKVKEFPINTQGWGITHDGKNLIISTGGNTLDYYEPSTFNKIKSLTVTDAGADSYNLNELEFIDGFIFANQWQAPYIFKINPADGKIVGKINLVKEDDTVKSLYRGSDVLNGIAYDETTKKIYITGKYWPVLYEIQFSQ